MARLPVDISRAALLDQVCHSLSLAVVQPVGEVLLEGSPQFGVAVLAEFSQPQPGSFALPAQLVQRQDRIFGFIQLRREFPALDLKDDPEYQEKLKSGKIQESTAAVEMAKEKIGNARNSLIIFLVAIVVVVLIGIFPQFRPTYEIFSGKEPILVQLEMGDAIMIIMLATAGIMMMFFKAKPGEAVKGSIMTGGVVAVISILGVSWMGSSFFEGNRIEIVGGISDLIQKAPWVLALGLFVLSMLLFSQAATVVTLMPVGVALGMPLWVLIAVYPAVNGFFFLPTYGTVLAAVSFDRTGTTKIGKYLLNHSFMLPGIVCLVATTIFAFIISSFVL